MWRKLRYLYFSFDGRVSRRAFILGTLSVFGLINVIMYGLHLAATTGLIGEWAIWVISAPFPLIAMRSFAALAAKRAHDLGEKYVVFGLRAESLEFRMWTEEGEAAPNQFGPTPFGLSRPGPLVLDD